VAGREEVVFLVSFGEEVTGKADVEYVAQVEDEEEYTAEAEDDECDNDK